MEQPPQTRKPGELIFAILVATASLSLLINAYGIAGLTALSSPGAIPMATTGVMLITAVMIVIRTARRAPETGTTFLRDVLPTRISIVIALLVGYAFALKALGFLPTSALFLIVLIRLLGQRSWLFCIGTGLACLIAIYLIFRIVFSVLMPAGIVPEGEILAWLGNLFASGE